MIEEAIADVDTTAGEIILHIHWKGGVHTELRLPWRRRGQMNHTSKDVVAAVRSLARFCSDGVIAGVLKRNELRTGRGNRWTRERVVSLRAWNDIPCFSRERCGREGWLKLNEAAAALGLSPAHCATGCRTWRDRGRASAVRRALDHQPPSPRVSGSVRPGRTGPPEYPRPRETCPGPENARVFRHIARCGIMKRGRRTGGEHPTMIAPLMPNVSRIIGPTALAIAWSFPLGSLAQTLPPVVPPSPARVPPMPAVVAPIQVSGQPVPPTARLGPEADRLWQEMDQLQKEGRLPEAASKAQELAKLIRRIVGERHPSYAIVLNNLGWIPHAAGGRCGGTGSLRAARGPQGGSGRARRGLCPGREPGRPGAGAPW